MKIYLIDINPAMIEAWQYYFKDLPAADIEIAHTEFKTFMDTHPTVGYVVSPANSYGDMSGGYDLAIRDYFDDLCRVDTGFSFQEVVRRAVKLNGNYIVPGSCFPIYISKSTCDLLLCPTMRRPSPVEDWAVVYECMLSALGCWYGFEYMDPKGDTPDIVIPAFGALCGEVPPMIVARNMRLAYDRATRKQESNVWKHADNIDADLRKARSRDL